MMQVTVKSVDIMVKSAKEIASSTVMSMKFEKTERDGDLINGNCHKVQVIAVSKMFIFIHLLIF